MFVTIRTADFGEIWQVGEGARPYQNLEGDQSLVTARVCTLNSGYSD